MEGKFLKKYNKSTGEWEVISSPDVSIKQVLSGDTPIIDTNVVVTNYQYSGETGNTTLNDTLGVIGDDIAKLKRNVSWLAEHGGGGSGGGGTQQSYGIVLVSPTLQNGAIYTSSDKLTVKFMITGGTSGDICKYSITYDSSSSGYTEIEVGTEVTFTVDNSKSSLMTHSMTISAVNPFSNTIAPLSFYIYISKFTVVNDTSINIPGSIQYIQGIYNVSKTYTDAYIPLNIQCGLLKAVVTIAATWNSVVKTFTFTSTTTEIQSINIPLWDIIGEGVINNLYIIDFTAQAQFGDMPAIEADAFRISIKVVNPNQLAITSTVNAEPGESEEITVPYKEIMSYAFTFLGPSTISNIKYASKIKNGSNEFLINGSKYYDETLKETGCTYLDNESTVLEATVSKNYTINDGFTVGDTPELWIKGWSYNGDYSAETKIQLRVIAQSTNIFPRQINAQTMFASWNNSYNVTNKDIWESKISDYSYMYNAYIEKYGTECDNILQVYNSNENSGLISTSGLLNLRLQNRAYAKIDASKYSKEIEFISGAISRSSYRGFTISFTFYSDSINNNSNIFLWGYNNANGELHYGLKIKSDKAYWNFYDKNGGYSTISVNIPNEVKTTVDFVYDATNQIVLIYVNGEPNAAKDLSDANGLSTSYLLPNEIYIGCDYYNSAIADFSDINVYEFNIITSLLNDMQININGKNARLNGLPSESSVIADYNTWKKKNFIYTIEGEESIPLSYLFDATTGKYIENFDENTVTYIKTNSNIPTVILKYDSEFTRDIFYKPASKEDAEKKYACTVRYYYPVQSGSGTECKFNGLTSLQGTSTLRYRIKNLELYTTEFTEEGETKPYLFQPINKWFPESEFTLKADVVDSSHANNAVIGEWINNSGLFSNTPPMDAYTGNEPKDIDQNGNIIKTIDPETQEETDYHKEVSIRHTLEGFPVLLFISFPNEATYDLIGIYSFNLGRNSYYNMGMKFLKNFCKRDSNGNLQSCPCIISKYEEMDTMGSIKASEIYSFEFINNKIEAASGQIFIPLWTQYDKGILGKMGEFKYPSTISDEIWGNLKSMFQIIAECPTGRYVDQNTFAYNGYQGMVYYYLDSQGNVVTDNTPIAQSDSRLTSVKNYIHLDNFYAYYTIANAFGLTDSLGKNLQLKSWDNGVSWWPCFYDMDTALGLENTGLDNVPVTCHIDTFICSSETSSRITYTGITYHDINSSYAAADAKIWGLLRDLMFHYQNSYEGHYYEEVWAKLRCDSGKLSKHSTFIELIESKVNTCGELVYCKDYYSKYITKGEDTDPSISFLHGNRIDFINAWLKKHFYFLDGMLDAKSYWASKYTFTSSDAPLYNDSFTWQFYYTAGNKVPFTIQATTPCFITLNTNSQAVSQKYYIGTANQDITIYYPNNTAANTQTTMYGSTLLTKLGGLESSGFRQIMSSSLKGALYLLKEVNISNNNQINAENPLNDLNQFLKSNYSGAETINFSNMKYGEAYEGSKSFPVDFTKFSKILYLYIQNSDINSLVLPSTSLQALNVTYSNIVAFNLKNQNILTEVSLEGCDKLTTISFDNCNAISNINISNKANLANLAIYNCSGLTSVTISGNPALTSIIISNCSNLEEIIIDKCLNTDLEIKILGSQTSLKKISISNLETTKEIIFPNYNTLGSVTSLTISNCYYISGWKFNDTDLEQYTAGTEVYNVFDLTPFSSLEGENTSIRNIDNLRYLRLPNDDGSAPVTPFKIYLKTFEKCKNLTKIFGYIEIAWQGIFNGLTSFYINHDSTNTGETPNFIYKATDKYYTNVKIGSTDLSHTFESTNCDINDAYYILHSCDENVSNISYLFNNCTNIIVNPISENTFVKCSSVTNINYLFGGGCQINGILPSNLFAPLIDNLTEFKYVLSGNYGSTSVDTCFFPDGNKIEYLEGFNPKAFKSSGGETLFRDPYMLSTLKKVKVIKNSFNDCQINYAEITFDATELFMYTTELLEIISSFNYIRTDGACRGSLGNIFGGYSNEMDKYPRKLKSVLQSFNINKGSHIDAPLYPNDTKANGILFPLDNYLLRGINSTIEYITGINNGENKTYGFETSLDYSASFTGKGILKYIANFNYGNHTDHCDGEDFPYYILSGCTNLKEYPNLFERAHNYKNDGSGVFSAITVSLPNSIFADAINIENISNCFSNMHSSITVTLTSKGLKNNKIINADNLFCKNLDLDEYEYKINGQIPYGLLYQETVSSTTAQSGLTYQDALSYGINPNTANTYADISILTEEECSIGDEYVVFNDENNNSKISKYQVTGFTEYGETIWIKMDLSNEGTISSLGQYTNYTGETFYMINPTIKTAEYAFYGLNSSAMTSYTADINTWEDLVEDNPDYNPILYILDSENNYRINDKCNPFKKLWNKYVFDNTSEFANYISSTGILLEEDLYGNKIVNSSLMPKEFNDGFVIPIQYNRINDTYSFGNDGYYSGFTDTTKISNLICTNYLCAPDIFRSFLNKKNTNISRFFMGSSSIINYLDGDFYINGLRGTLPEFIFEPISNIESLDYIFASDKSIFPSQWHYYTDQTIEHIGETYPQNLFSGLTSLYSIQGLFKDGRIWGRTCVPLLFANTPSLSNASGLWDGATWIEDNERNAGSIYSANTISQLDANIFINNGNLTNISTMLGNSGSHCLYTIAPIVSATYHPSLNDCSSFLYNATRMHGTVPALWEFNSLILNSFHYAFKGLTHSYIDNYSAENFEKFERDY